VSSVGTFNSALNNGTWTLDHSTNTFVNLTNATSGVVQMGASDVIAISGNFVNISTNANSYDTLAGKFLFNGVATTQKFYAAGHEMGLAPNPSNPTNWLPGNAIGFTNNFALGTLEIANFSTVRVSDAFSLLGPGTNDGLRAALYVNNLFLDVNSFLIVDTNVTVYFANSNNWTAANFVLLGDAELHQIFIPEPSVLLLAVGGGVIVTAARRRRRQK
jgi:hypothetical protein